MCYNMITVLEVDYENPWIYEGRPFTSDEYWRLLWVRLLHHKYHHGTEIHWKKVLRAEEKTKRRKEKGHKRVRLEAILWKF